jgi:hypothetical protein
MWLALRAIHEMHYGKPFVTFALDKPSAFHGVDEVLNALPTHPAGSWERSKPVKG